MSVSKSISQTEQELVAVLLTDLIDKADPSLSAGLLVASASNEFDLPLFTQLRGRKDETDQEVYAQIQALQFVHQSGNKKISLPKLHRGILHRIFSQINRDGLIDTHRRAAEFMQTDEMLTGREARCNLIFHHLLAGAATADPTQVNGLPQMLQLFQELADENNIPAIERLLAFCTTTRIYLKSLEPSWLQAYDDLIALMTARLEQLRGNYELSHRVLAPIMSRRDILPDHAPYLLRTHGDNLAQSSQFIEAIDLYSEALTRLDKEILQRKVVNPDGREWEILEAEQANLHIAMGDAHLELALEARGSRLPRHPHSQFDRVRNWLSSLASLPLVLYLTRKLGGRAWRPELWIAIGSEDWIVTRLIVTALGWYDSATQLTQLRSNQREKDRLVEKRARLFLELGDWSMAQQLYEGLWQKGRNELGEYRRGHVALGLAEATFQLGNTGQAFVRAEEAVSIFEKFKDHEPLAHAQGTLARILVKMRNFPAALSAFNQAFRNFEMLNNWIDATHLAEYLEQLVQVNPAFPESLKEQGIRLSDSLLQRQYVKQFVHPGHKQLRLTAMASFALMVLAVPLLVLTFNEALGIVPITDFNPGHLLDLDQPIDIDISNGLLESAGVRPVYFNDATVLARTAVLTVLVYGAILLGLGLIFLVVTPNDSVELSDGSDHITLDRNGIMVGNRAHLIEYKWQNIKKIIRANLAFLERLPLYSSSFGLQTNSGQLTIRGDTAWFSSLRRRIEWQAPDAQVKQLDYAISRSIMFVIYAAGLFSMVGYLLFAWLFEDRLWNSFGKLAFRPADMYPWLFLALFMPPIWWGLVVRWRHKLALQPTSFWPWSLLIGGASLSALQILTRLRPLLTVPDIYIPFLAIFLLVGGGVFVWQVHELGTRVYRRVTRYPVLILALVLAAANGGRIIRDTQAWFSLVNARAFVIKAQSLEGQHPNQMVYRQARALFNHALTVQNMPSAWFAEEDAARMSFGLPSPQSLVSTQATLGLGATSAKLGNYEEAIVAFKQASRVMKFTQQQGLLNAWIGISRQSDRPAEDERFALVRENYEIALEDFGWAFEQDPAGDHYLLYEGLSYHTLGNLTQARENYLRALNLENGRGLTAQEQAQAYIGLGWILYEQQDLGEALLQFEQAILAAREVNEANPDNPPAVRELADAELGFGYTAYELGQYDLADRSFEIAHDLLPFEPIPLVALGSVNLRLGTFAHDGTRGNDVCLLNNASPEAKEKAKEHYLKSAEYLTLASEKLNQTDAEIAHIFRTRGQVHFLLRNCPGMDVDEQLAAGSQSYTRAISYAPEDDRYWQLRARFGMSRWLNSQQDQALEPVLFRSLADIRQAMALNPDNSIHEDWYESIFDQVATITGEDAIREWEAAVDASKADTGGMSGLTPVDFTGCYSAQFISQSASTYLPQKNQLFRITWQLRNRGNCAWDETVRFKHVDGDRMGAQEIVDIPRTRSGETADITVALVAPPEPGNYRGEWVLINESGAEISSRQWFVIEVR